MNESVPTCLLPPLLPLKNAGGNGRGNAQKTAIFSYLLPPSLEKEKKSMGDDIYKSVWRRSNVGTGPENGLAASFHNRSTDWRRTGGE
jgi:hypothetical protein